MTDRYERNTRKNRILREIKEDVILLLIVIGVVFVVRRYLLLNAVIPSGSMENTIMTDDRVFGNRVSYLLGEPQRGDIAIFRYPDDETKLYIKRVIGLPGDKIEIIDGQVYINDSDTPLEEPYLKETPIGDYGPYYVPDDCYFMMGDNRNDSKDSRYWDMPYVTKENMLAKAFFRYYPLNKIGTIG